MRKQKPIHGAGPPGKPLLPLEAEVEILEKLGADLRIGSGEIAAILKKHGVEADVERLQDSYGQTTLSTHPRERSGVLYIKEATKKGWKAAYPGDTVDLGYAGSNTRRGRVGHDIAHTLETSSIQGIVERGGRIRRLMPRECFRLQGFEDEQIDKILAITSDAQAYKQAGNGVTVNVVEAIGRRIRAVDEQLRKEDAAA